MGASNMQSKERPPARLTTHHLARITGLRPHRHAFLEVTASGPALDADRIRLPAWFFFFLFFFFIAAGLKPLPQTLAGCHWRFKTTSAPRDYRTTWLQPHAGENFVSALRIHHHPNAFWQAGAVLLAE